MSPEYVCREVRDSRGGLLEFLCNNPSRPLVTRSRPDLRGVEERLDLGLVLKEGAESQGFGSSGLSTTIYVYLLVLSVTGGSGMSRLQSESIFPLLSFYTWFKMTSSFTITTKAKSEVEKTLR